MTTIMGYKGQSQKLTFREYLEQLERGSMDSGLFYCPYIPLMSCGTVHNADGSTEKITLMTRYGPMLSGNLDV